MAKRKSSTPTNTYLVFGPAGFIFAYTAIELESSGKFSKWMRYHGFTHNDGFKMELANDTHHEWMKNEIHNEYVF